jgi:hypothetical protein
LFTFITQVLPKARIKFSPEKQRELLYQSLCVMPLKLLERVLPWFIVKLNDAEAVSFLQNMRLAGCLCYVPTSLLNNKTVFRTFPNFLYLMNTSQHLPLKLHWLLFSLAGRAKVVWRTHPTLESSYAWHQERSLVRQMGMVSKHASHSVHVM